MPILDINNNGERFLSSITDYLKKYFTPDTSEVKIKKIKANGYYLSTEAIPEIFPDKRYLNEFNRKVEANNYFSRRRDGASTVNIRLMVDGKYSTFVFTKIDRMYFIKKCVLKKQWNSVESL